MTIVAISGGFDPIHKGHINMIREAAEQFGTMCSGCGKTKARIHIYLTSDEWMIRREGFKFMSFGDRAAVLSAIQGVEMVFPVIDTDDTVCETIRTFKPDVFVNGGDRGPENTPELRTCNDLKIRMVFGVGGNKIESSSEMIKRIKENA